jgi:hypothetical protein
MKKKAIFLTLFLTSNLFFFTTSYAVCRNETFNEERVECQKSYSIKYKGKSIILRTTKKLKEFSASEIADRIQEEDKKENYPDPPYTRISDPSQKQDCAGYILENYLPDQNVLWVEPNELFIKLFEPFGKRVNNISDIKKGDVVFFGQNKGRFMHVALVVDRKAEVGIIIETKDRDESLFETHLPWPWPDLDYDNVRDGWSMRSLVLNAPKRDDKLFRTYSYYQIWRVEDKAKIEIKELKKGICDCTQEWQQQIDKLITTAEKQLRACQFGKAKRILKPLKDHLEKLNQEDRNVRSTIWGSPHVIERAKELEEDIKSAKDRYDTANAAWGKRDYQEALDQYKAIKADVCPDSSRLDPQIKRLEGQLARSRAPKRKLPKKGKQVSDFAITRVAPKEVRVGKAENFVVVFTGDAVGPVKLFIVDRPCPQGARCFRGSVRGYSFSKNGGSYVFKGNTLIWKMGASCAAAGYIWHKEAWLEDANGRKTPRFTYTARCTK